MAVHSRLPDCGRSSTHRRARTSPAMRIMTIDSNDHMRSIHNRMPVILDSEGHDRWLDLDADPADVLMPCPSDRSQSTSASGTRGTTMRG